MPVAKQYPAIATAGVLTKRVAPAADERIALRIQNTGLNPGFIRFDQQIDANSAANFVLNPGDHVKFDNPETCPKEAINIASVLGTTFAILETIKDR